ncbi:MAG: DUF4258 domain-containing protein [Cytophagaceae bacterium]|nr:DUF4258 domain-containing protein [Cytophagaceae bacterium]
MFDLSSHAIEQAELRQIKLETIFKILENPDSVIEEGNGQLIYQKIENEFNRGNYLYRVFVNSNKNPKLVKTVYKTSKIEKYL